MTPPAAAETRFRTIFRRIHAYHYACIRDEWLMEPCRDRTGEKLDRPIVWSRRNGPWRRVEILWVGAAPGNAGKRGSGDLGAHGTRIPFGGDIAGANLEVLFGSIGLTRNDTFITAALDRLPDAGGGEPTPAEIARPVGSYPNSLFVMRDTLVATGPRLVIALGAVGLRALLAAAAIPVGSDEVSVSEAESSAADGTRPVALPGTGRLTAAGLERGRVADWPEAFPPSEATSAAWAAAWGPDTPFPAVLWLLHPSGQNMSPFAGPTTMFHQRMLETRAALIEGVRQVLGWQIPDERPPIPTTGIYALPEWRSRIAPRLEQMDRAWRAKGV